MRLPSANRWSALVVWAGAAACAAFWASRVLVKAPDLPTGATTVPSVQALRGDISRLLGEAEVEAAETPVVAAPSRFRLLGVVAPRAPQAVAEGVALIAVDDKPAKAFRVGATVDGALVLQKVHARGADLGARDAAQASVSLTVQPLPPAATGVPTSRAPGAAPTFAPPRPPTPRPMSTAPRVEPADPTGEPDAGAEDGEGAPAPALRPGLATQ
jgi:general secretion pathway protein C